MNLQSCLSADGRISLSFALCFFGGFFFGLFVCFVLFCLFVCLFLRILVSQVERECLIRCSLMKDLQSFYDT